MRMRMSSGEYLSSILNRLSSTSSVSRTSSLEREADERRTFSTLFPTLLSSSSLHQDVAAFYDVPSLSVRDIILPQILADPNDQLPKWFRTGDTVILGDNKVREWGGVPVDLMHVSWQS